VLCDTSEHLSLPDVEDVRQGVIASRIAAHAADIAKGVVGAADWDLRMLRRENDLTGMPRSSLSMTPEHSRAVHQRHSSGGEACSMCGDYCATAPGGEYLNIPMQKC